MNSDNPLRERIEPFLKTTIRHLNQYPSLRGLQRKFEAQLQQLDQPMRVAVVGRIKAGKSTTMNALLGEALAAMGSLEATFNINWFKYGDTPRLVVQFKDGGGSKEASFTDLQALTRRAEDPKTLAYLKSIQYIEVFHPNEILKQIDLIDTPGLFSSHEVDDENTRKFLAVSGTDITQVTTQEMSKADAILYLFRSSSLSESDQKVMEMFQGPVSSSVSALNAIAVLNQADGLWNWSDGLEKDPLSQAQKVTERLLQENPQLQNLFYVFHPVISKLGLGAVTLTQAEFEILTKLAKLPVDSFNRLISNASRFNTREYPEQPEIPPVAERVQVWERLDLYGLVCAYQLLQPNDTLAENCSLKALSKQLLAKSGVEELQQLIINHFGRQAYLIKFSRCLQEIKHAIDQTSRSQEGQERQFIEQLAAQVEELEFDELIYQGFRELAVLKSLYSDTNSQSQIETHPLSPEEREELLQVAGQRGRSLAALLGLPEDAALSVMQTQCQQRLIYWRIKQNDTLTSSPKMTQITTVICQAYERFMVCLNKAADALGETKAEYLKHPEMERLVLFLEQCREIPQIIDCRLEWQQLKHIRQHPKQLTIQYQKLLERLKQICFELKKSQSAKIVIWVEELANQLEQIEVNDIDLKLIQLWQGHHQQKTLQLEESVLRKLEGLMGEKGSRVCKRLGLAEGSSLEKMRTAVEQEKRYWLGLMNDPFGCDAQTRWVASVMLQAYEHLNHQLNSAFRYLHPK